MNARKVRWFEFLCEFDFEIKHVKEKENKVVDALSLKFYVAALSVFKSDFSTRVLEAQNNDKTYLQVKDKL